MTQDHGIIIFASLKFSFFTWVDRIVHMCQISSYRAGCCNIKGTDWAPGAWAPAQALSPTSCVTSKKSLLGTSVFSSITQEFCAKWSLRPSRWYFRIGIIYCLETATEEKRRPWRYQFQFKLRSSLRHLCYLGSACGLGEDRISCLSIHSLSKHLWAPTVCRTLC